MDMDKGYFVTKNFPLQEYNTMRISSVAEEAYLPYSKHGIEQLFSEIDSEKAIVIGQGSNIILSQKSYTKPIVITSLLNRIENENDDIVVDTGVTLSKLAWYALEKSCIGFEFLEDIPGTVAGALVMNAGTYDDALGNLVKSVTVYDYNEKCIKNLTAEQLKPFWGKRQSYFQVHPCFIIQARFASAHKGNYEEILDKMLEIKRRRYLKQPREYPSAGSVFKRPYINGEPRYVWRLFEEAGLSGVRFGDAQVSEKHPGFIINVGDATGQDVVGLMNHCREVVFKQYGIQLEVEWIIV